MKIQKTVLAASILAAIGLPVTAAKSRSKQIKS